VLLVVAGTAMLLDAFIRSVREGEGTPAPVAPPPPAKVWRQRSALAVGREEDADGLVRMAV
jgi:hypothetical protein